MSSAVQLQHIGKRYGRTQVLDDVSIELPKGKTTLILGHNGCGKTTLLKCIIGLVRPDRGDITFADLDARETDVRHLIGYLPQKSFFPDNITPEEIFELIASMRPGVPLTHDRLVDQFTLQPFLHKRVKELSGGTLQKVGVVSALMTQPKILLLDEPTAGLDPKSRFIFKQLIDQQKALGVTTVITSHIISEHEQGCDNIVVLTDGRVAYSGLASDLRAGQNGQGLEGAIVNILEKAEGSAWRQS